MAERTNVATLQRVQNETSDRKRRSDSPGHRRQARSFRNRDKLGERIHETFDWHE